jgi:hypothetical protein
MLSDKQLPDSYEEVNFVCNTDGTIRQGWVYKKGRKPIWSDEIIAYMCFNRFFLGDINYNLVRCNLWKGLEGSYGFYWSSSLYLSSVLYEKVANAYHLSFDSYPYLGQEYSYRYYGLPVRGVLAEN